MITTIMTLDIKTRLVNDIKVVDRNSKILMITCYGISVVCGVIAAMFTRVDLLALSAIFASIGCGFLLVASVNRIVKNILNCGKIEMVEE